MAKHEPHGDASGKHQWTAEGGHCACGAGVHALTPMEDTCPAALPIVVLRCRCGHPESHAKAGEHCPMAEVDVAASYEVGINVTTTP